MLYSKTLKIGKRDLFTFITLGVTSCSFSNCIEKLSISLVLLQGVPIKVTEF